jgi:exonuclease SbcC
VCGAREHPGADHRAAVTAIGLLERGVTAARRMAKAAADARTEAANQAASRDEEVRARSERMEAAGAAREAARAALAKLRSGEEEPRAVAEARAAAARQAERAELALGGLAADRREAVREAALREPPAAAEARVAALNRRAREAEALARALAAAKQASERSRADHAACVEAAARAARDEAEAVGLAKAAASLAAARRDEVDALLADLTPRGQGDLFAPQAAPKSAATWVAELEGKAKALTDREQRAAARLDEARERGERLSLAAREAAGRRDEAEAQLGRARTAAAEAVARAGFESLDALREALMDPAALAALEAQLGRLAQERDDLAAVLAARRRDVTVEVSEAEARSAETARDNAQEEASLARRRAAEARARSEELARRRARARELREKIDDLLPRAKRLGQIRQVVSSNQLSEFAAERHLEAVTRGAAALLGTLSSDRYALVRTEEGAFAVADRAHGGLVRPPSTLSGGETFLVSLSLALSLSERIQMAGRTRFDFFFLDEGFGSLDPATLEVALGALERLRGPNRVIGMISHVAAIEERMPRRLKVLTERRGGPTRVVHGP